MKDAKRLISDEKSTKKCNFSVEFKLFLYY